MENKSNWKEFRESGLLWFVNRSLHLFGWSIVYTMDEAGDIVSVSPDKVKYRGFSEEMEDKGFEKLTCYLDGNIERLKKDLKDE